MPKDKTIDQRLLDRADEMTEDANDLVRLATELEEPAMAVGFNVRPLFGVQSAGGQLVACIWADVVDEIVALDVFVRPEYRNQGLAGWLISEALRWAIRNSRDLRLSVTRSSFIEALPEEGFREVDGHWVLPDEFRDKLLQDCEERCAQEREYRRIASQD